MLFEIPQLKHEQFFVDYQKEFFDHQEDFIHGDGGCSRHPVYQEWLANDKNFRNDQVPDGYVGSTTYFAIDDNQIVGTVSIRHSLNENLLKSGGHIGYSVSPSKRRQGYATKILSFAIEECYKMNIHDILVTCKKNNIGSRKTIEKCHGQLENELTVQGEKILRFWIKGE